MAEAETKVPVTTESKPAPSPTAMQAWRPFEILAARLTGCSRTSP